MFAPGPNNEYLVLSSQDQEDEGESYEMQELLMQASSFADGMTRRSRGGHDEIKARNRGQEGSEPLLQHDQQQQHEEEGQDTDVLEAAYEVLNLAPEQRR